jgi:hypothetical protein
MTPQEAAKRWPHLIQIGEDGVPELFADNHILSHLRLCEAYFVENFMNNLHLKGERSWSLEFGIWFHSAMEWFYKNYPQQSVKIFNQPALECSDFASHVSKLWMDTDMNYFNSKPEYYKVCAKIGGLTGAINLAVQYWQMYGEGRDNLKVIGTELSFGRGKEVPIYVFPDHALNDNQFRAHMPFRAYYCGRIDAVGDEGNTIFPIDHKTTSTINPLTTGRDFKPHEGMQGYVYSLNKIATTFLPPGVKKSCNKALVNHVQVNYTADYTKRFKRTTLHYSPMELEAWRLRQVRTFQKLWQILVEEAQPDWNTQACHSIYNMPCAFRLLHEQDPINRESYLKAHYVTIQPWDAAKIEGLRKVSE